MAGEGATGGAAGGGATGGVTYSFYLDSYGESLEAGAFADALPSATHCLRALTGGVDASLLEGDDLDAWWRAMCAAADAFAEFGEGRVGGYEIGDFKVTNYMEKGTTGREVAVAAALEELAGTGLTFCGVA